MVQEPGAAVAAGASSDGRLWSSFLVTLLALAFVLALAWLLLRLFKRAMMRPRTGGGRVPLEVVEALSLGGRERLVVVRKGAREYVLGVTTASVSLLDKQVWVTGTGTGHGGGAAKEQPGSAANQEDGGDGRDGKDGGEDY